MRVAIVDPYYNAYLNSLYAEEPGLAGLPYVEQRGRVLDRFFGTADFFSHALRGLGHEAEDFIVNCEPLQQRWAAEAGLRLPRLRRRAPAAILDAQVEALDADVIYVHDPWAVPRRLLNRWRRARRLVVCQIASRPPRKQLLRGYELIITSFPHFVDRFRALGVETIYQPLAFEPRVLDRLGPRDPRWDAVFVGGINPRIYQAGTQMLEAIADEVDLQVWGYGADTLPESSPLRRRWRGEAWGMDMYRVLADARIVINRHGEVAEGYANTVRLYEATGVGAVVLTEAAPNLADLFVPGEEIVTYEDHAQIPALVQGLLQDPDRMAAIGQAGQARTLRDHTWPQRVAELVEILAPRVRR